VITRAEERDETIELVGAIARMVKLGNKRAALDARTACSVKVVTGTYNHRQFASPRLLSEAWPSVVGGLAAEVVSLGANPLGLL
jgi:hypothetical protein